MPPRSRSRGRERLSSPPVRNASRTSRSDYTKSPSPGLQSRRSDHSHHRDSSRSHSNRRNERHRADAAHRSPDRSVSRSRSRGRERSMTHSASVSRSRSRGEYSRSESPPIRSTKIVVERLTKNIKENNLREIFGAYGDIEDLDLPVNRQFGHNRGSAYIVYYDEADARDAIKHMHEAQIDGAIVHVSSVALRTRASPSPPPIARRDSVEFAGAPPRSRHGPLLGFVRPRGSDFRGFNGGRQANGGPLRRSPGPSAAVPHPGRYGHRSDNYRPRSLSRSPSRSPSRSRSPASGGAGGRRYRHRSRSYSSRSRSRSRTPPRRGGRGGRGGNRRYGNYNGRERRYNDREGSDRRRRAPSRDSYDSLDERRRSRSRSRDHRRR